MKQVFKHDPQSVKSLVYRINKLLPSLALALSLVITNTAFAGYKPPANPSRPKIVTGSNSTRTNGCTGDSPTSLTALAPLGYAGQTVSLQPTFTWFVPNAPNREVEFSLYEYTSDGKSKRVYRTKQKSENGIMKLSLPQQEASLSVGSKYWWQVALLCNPNHPSEDLLVTARLEVVAIPTDLQNALSQTQDSLQRAELYASRGLWYDALAEALNNSTNKKAVLNLLTDLSKLEVEEAKKQTEEKRQKELQEQSLRLEKIISSQT